MPRQTNSYFRSRSKHTASFIGLLLKKFQINSGARSELISPRLFLLGVVMVILGAALCTQIVARQVEEARLEFQVNQIRQQNLELRMQVHQKQSDVTRLQSLDRIRQIAVVELGMEPAASVPVVRLTGSQWAQQLAPQGGGSR